MLPRTRRTAGGRSLVAIAFATVTGTAGGSVFASEVADASPAPPMRLRLAPRGAAEVEPADDPASQPVAEQAPQEPTYDTAEAAFYAGSQAYALGHYDQAVVAFERSYALSGSPELLFNIGQAYVRWYSLSEDRAHLRQARVLFDNYSRFLNEAEVPDAEAIADAEARLAEVERLLAESKPGEPVPKPKPEPEPKPKPEPELTPVDQPVTETAPAKRPLVRRGWFWGVVIGGAAVIAGAITAGVLLSRDPTTPPELGIIRAQPGLPPPAQGALLRF